MELCSRCKERERSRTHTWCSRCKSDRRREKRAEARQAGIPPPPPRAYVHLENVQPIPEDLRLVFARYALERGLLT